MGNEIAALDIERDAESGVKVQSAAFSGYIPGFDGLRAIAVGTVLVAHGGYGYLFPGGFGVTIFFTISGYLITTLLLGELENTGTINLKLFYARRLIRLYPELIVLIFLCGLSGLILDLRATGAEWLAGPFYYMNYYYVFGHHYTEAQSYPWRQLWSLSVEEHFYIFFPGLLLFAASTEKKRLYLVYGLILLPLLWRFVSYFIYHLPWQYNYVATDTRIDSIAWGCLLAILLRPWDLPDSANGKHGAIDKPLFIRRPMALLGVALILASLLYRDEAFRWTWRFSVQGLGMFLLIANLLFDPHWRAVVTLLELKPLRYIGRISYGLYLYHMLINRLMLEYLPGISVPIFLAMSLILSVLTASLSYIALETPLKGIRRRLGSHVR